MTSSETKTLAFSILFFGQIAFSIPNLGLGPRLIGLGDLGSWHVMGPYILFLGYVICTLDSFVCLR